MIFLIALLMPFAIQPMAAVTPPEQEESVAPHKTPEEIEAELQKAERQFIRAQRMFNPWYTGPLITPSASMMPVGSANVQPYLYLTDNYAAFNTDRHSVGFDSDLFSVRGLLVAQTGITDTMDINITISGQENWQFDHSSGGFQDMVVTLGFPIFLQTRYIPQFKFTVAETFPTGKYKNLNKNGLLLDSTGGGSFQTQLGLSIAKLFFYTTQHPVNTRLFVGYILPSKVEVSGFNTYGGGFGTRGTVRPGTSFSSDLGIEFSMTQRWVLATDVVYTFTNRTTFTGIPGTLANGAPATVGTGYSDSLSLAPAIEYNWNANLGILGGVWFTVYGRNSTNFISGILSLTYTFP